MKKLTDIVKDMTGEVVCFGVKDEAIMNLLQRNKNTNAFLINREPRKSIFTRRKKVKIDGQKKGKKMNMKKIRKTFKKKSVDYILCDFNEIYDYFKYFIYDSTVINKGKLYLYGKSKYIDANRIGKRFERFHGEVTVSITGEDFLIIVDNHNSKGNWLKAKWYIIIDSFHNLGDMISAALIS